SNVLAVALGESVYLWNAENGAITHLLELESEEAYVSSVSFIRDGRYLAVGTSEACVQLWDVEHQRQVRRMDGHQARVGALAWCNHILSSGSYSGHIIDHDVRVAQHYVGTYAGHTQEVCGLRW